MIMGINRTTKPTASIDISELLEFGCIKQIEGTAGRNISYEIDVEQFDHDIKAG